MELVELFRDDFPPLLRASEPFVRNLNPLVTGLNLYKHEVAATAGNLAATFHGQLTQENEKGEHLRYLRLMGPINAESLSTYSSRLLNNRNSAYSAPGWAELLKNGSLPGYNTSQCTAGASVTINPESVSTDPTTSEPNTPASKAFFERTPAIIKKLNETTGKSENMPITWAERKAEAEELLTLIKKYAFGGQDGTAGAPTPPCNQQGSFKSIYGNGEKTQYQHTFEQPAK